MSITAGISKHVRKALEAFCKSDLEESLYQIAPAIDATAKKRYPSATASQRVKKFLADEQEMIFGFSTQNRVKVDQGAKILHGQDGELQQIIYKYIRCAQSHEAEYDSNKILLEGEFGVGRFRLEGLSPQIPADKYLISKATVLALIFSVICASENQNIDISGVSFHLFGQSINVPDYLGKRDDFIKFYSSIF